MPYNHELFVLVIITWSYNCLLSIIIIIIISNLKPDNCVQTNYYDWIEIITWNHTSLYQLFVLDKNTLTAPLQRGKIPPP